MTKFSFKHTEETKQKMCIVALERNKKKGIKAKLKTASNGYHHSLNTIEKIKRNHWTGKQHSDETKRKVSISMGGTGNKKESRFYRDYGLTYAEYGRICEEQNSLCKICGKANLSGKKLSTDHNHKTGKVRGLLCSKCNLGIGLFHDDINILKLVIEYLKDGKNVDEDE